MIYFDEDPDFEPDYNFCPLPQYEEAFVENFYLLKYTFNGYSETVVTSNDPMLI